MPELNLFNWDKAQGKAVPRGALPMHMIHYMNTREQMMKDNEKADKKLTTKQINKNARAHYNRLGEDEKAKLRELHQKDKARFEKETEEMGKKGFFTMTDGKKSNAIDAPKKPSMSPAPKSNKKKTMGKKK